MCQVSSSNSIRVLESTRLTHHFEILYSKYRIFIKMPSICILTQYLSLTRYKMSHFKNVLEQYKIHRFP